jgi:hypothetical protein
MTPTWTIEWMQCKPQEGSLTDVVVTAGWRCNGVDGSYTGTVYGTCSFPVTQGSSFVPYNRLTEQTVLGWCWANGVDKAATEAAVAQQIADQKNPPVVQPPLPWAQS